MPGSILFHTRPERDLRRGSGGLLPAAGRNHLDHGINTIRLLFDCKVVVGGYLGQFAEKYLSQLQDKVKELDPFSDDVSYLSFCKYKNEAAATGAALMYIDEFISSI